MTAANPGSVPILETRGANEGVQSTRPLSNARTRLRERDVPYTVQSVSALTHVSRTSHPVVTAHRTHRTHSRYLHPLTLSPTLRVSRYLFVRHRGTAFSPYSSGHFHTDLSPLRRQKRQEVTGQTKHFIQHVGDLDFSNLEIYTEHVY